ncbi:DUF4254 domain-containing protein [Amycolatopsis sp. NPDC051071]|uniref:DUF4254 domain-containing protein n=1 Tax=Amycolatopsis sp. NPDC051071 TaxID=3154637 RepID=UPI00341F74FD
MSEKANDGAWYSVLGPGTSRSFPPAAYIADADDTITAAVVRRLRRHDRVIADQVARIDRHVLRLLQHHRGGALHTETLGTLLSRLAQAWQHSQQLAVLPVRDPRVHDASAALAELSDAYDDLTHDVLLGRRRLPRHQVSDLHGKA